MDGVTARAAALELATHKIAGEYDRVRDAGASINQRSGVDRHHLLVVLGSGFAPVAEQVGLINAVIPFAEIPGLPTPTAEGHGSNVYSLTVPVGDSSVNVLVASGRSHLYEGLTPTEVCRFVRVGALTGVDAALLTNAGGCLEAWNLGDLMVISDHLNFTHNSPFVGPVFTDISGVWDARLQTLLGALTQRQGTYAALCGPEFQTQAESRWLRSSGAHMVGMSTVLEAISLHQLGVRVAGISLVSDLSFAPTACTHEEVLAAAQGAQPTLKRIIESLCQHLATDPPATGATEACI